VGSIVRGLLSITQSPPLNIDMSQDAILDSEQYASADFGSTGTLACALFTQLGE
jgi:hypothetical protein